MHTQYTTRSLNLLEAQQVFDWLAVNCPRTMEDAMCASNNEQPIRDLHTLATICHPHEINHHVQVDVMMFCAQEAMMFKLVWG